LETFYTFPVVGILLLQDGAAVRALEEGAMTWEYKIVFFSSEPLKDEGGYETSLHDGLHVLNELGGQGWELVQFLAHPLSDDVWKHHAVFKRPRAA